MVDGIPPIEIVVDFSIILMIGKYIIKFILIVVVVNLEMIYIS